MSYKTKHTKQIVYAFVVIPLALLIIVAVFIALKQNLFEKKYLYTTMLQNATGISRQTPILYKGFEIGKVKEYELTESGNIRVVFYVLKRYRQIMVNPSAILRITIPITNMTTLEYICDPLSKELLPPESFVPSSDFPEGRALLKTISPEAGDPITGIIENIHKLTTELNRDNNADQGTLARTLFNVANATEELDQLLAEMNSIFAEMSVFTANLNRDGNADAGVVFRTLNNVADISGSLNQQMVRLDTLLIQINKIAANFSDPEGLIVKMIDPCLDLLIQPLSKSLTALHQSLEATAQLLGSLQSNSPQLSILINNLNDTLGQAKHTLEALNNNPILRSGITPSSNRPASFQDRISEFPDAR